MRTSLKVLIAGGALAVAGVAVAADRTHVLNVAMPDGSIAHIRYVGDVPPNVVVAPVAMPAAFAGEASPFALFDRVAAQMDAQMGAMLSQVSTLASVPAAYGQVSDAALKAAPAGMVSYSFTSFSSGNGAACSQSVQVTSLGANQAPKVERQSSGDCSAVSRRTPTPAVATPAAKADPAPIPVRLETTKTTPAPHNTI